MNDNGIDFEDENEDEDSPWITRPKVLISS